MAGERSERAAALATRAAARTSRRLQKVLDYYSDTPQADEAVLTLKEMFEEQDRHGHLPPHPTCQSPTCVKARQMLSQAMQQFEAEQAQMQQQGAV